MNIFEKASQLKLRIAVPTNCSTSGLLRVDDLWDLPLINKSSRVSLKDIAEDLQSKIGVQPTKLDFFDDKADFDPELQLAFDIVKHVVITKREEALAKRNAKATDTENERIMALIAKKEEESLGELSIEELKARLK